MDQKPLANGNKKPRIALLHYSGPPMISGVDVLLKDQARLFRQFGYRVDIVAGIARQFRKDIPVHIIRRMSPKHPLTFRVRHELERGEVTHTFRQLETSLYKSIKKYLLKNQIRVCILHNLFTRHYNLALTAALAELISDVPDVKFYAWVHNINCFEDPYLGLNPKLTTMYPWNLLSNPIQNLSYVCVSQYLKRNLLATFGVNRHDDVLVIHNVHDIPKFLGLSPIMRAFYKDIEGLDSDLIACIPVRAVPRKKLEYAIDIAQALVSRGVNFKLILTANIDYKRVENQEYYIKLKEKVKSLHLEKTVYFLEEFVQWYAKLNLPGKPTPPIPIPEVYIISDFLLLTSEIEEFGLPILEAGLMRCPIFATDIPALREIGTTNINYFRLSQNPAEVADFILGKMKALPQAYFYRKVIKNFSLYTKFKNVIIPLIEQFNSSH